MAAELRPYQVEGAAWLREKGSALLGDAMGTGKSATLIAASRGETLVVAPAMLLHSGTWKDQIDLWSDDPERFTCVSYTSLWNRSAKKLKSDLDRRWDTIIFDEAHFLKNVKSQRYRAARALRKKTDAAYFATGTPIPNWPEELFALLTLIFPEDSVSGRRLGSKWRWVGEWFQVTANVHNRNAMDVGGLLGCTHAGGLWGVPCECFQKFARENLKDRYLARSMADIGHQLPPLTEQTVPCPMTFKQWRAYKDMKLKHFTEVLDDELIAFTSGGAYVKADRLTTGAGLATPEAEVGVIKVEESGKLEQLKFDLENRSSPTLVFGHYKQSVKACEQIAVSLGLNVARIDGDTSQKDRREYLESFQRGELDVLVGTLEVMAEGLTLTRADMIIFVEQSWKPTRNEQAKARIHRLGQDKPCTIRDYVATGPKGESSLDTNKRKVLKEKTESQIKTMTAANFRELM